MSAMSSGPAELDRIAAEAGVPAEQLRTWLRQEVQRRRRERHRMHDRAHMQLDRRLAKIAKG